MKIKVRIIKRKKEKMWVGGEEWKKKLWRLHLQFNHAREEKIWRLLEGVYKEKESFKDSRKGT